jgi:hypothetical protein
MSAHATISADLTLIVVELAEPCPLLWRAPNGRRIRRTKVKKSHSWLGVAASTGSRPFSKTANFTPFESSSAAVRGR